MRFFAVLLGVLALFVTGIPPAAAHAGLVSSDPANGSLLTTAPSQVTLTFNEDLLETMVNVSVLDANNAVISADVAEAAGPTVIVGWPSQATDGTYRLAYRVVSADGHPVTGEIEFTIDAAATPADITAAAERIAESQSAIPGWVFIVGIGLIVGVAISVFTVLLSKRRV
jgi:methionine-rich copper-binding protein CopC